MKKETVRPSDTALSDPRKLAIDFSRSAVPRYVQLASLFRNRVESGEWPVGAQIPTVDDLAEECQVARATVRQSLDLLEEEKLIARYRAKGTFVIGKPQEQFWCEVATDWSGQLLAPEGATIEILTEREQLAPMPVDPAIGEMAQTYQHWRRRHWRNGRPYYLGDVYIDAEVCARIPKKSFETKTSMRILRDLPGLEIVEAHQTLTLGSADPQIADLLQIPLNAPIAYVTRSAVDQSGRVVFVGRGIYRGDVIRLDIRLK
ncbi:GntR family transcriptional regulator [Herbaspirillum sp. alder98]|uniref:GntR family transcriptional regulator n=1 Tax=Herbaspirillum sp. alder98 TaxID=2913096 RepID=UPI001CD8DE06|nr:GntR family transcriptional regulator [Herbaspirillum sp. alder98]MCA1325085.1 GntR family transcriptional regulator [Herbaspirillum sp. alder98]